jgi:hypothetical protein
MLVMPSVPAVPGSLMPRVRVRDMTTGMPVVVSVRVHVR